MDNPWKEYGITPSIGGKVRVKDTCKFSGDWPGEYFIVGLTLNHKGELDVWINDEFTIEGCVDEWPLGELVPVSQACNGDEGDW